MENELLECLTQLTNIKKYLVKKGKSRFLGNIIKNKLAETENVFQKSSTIITFLTTNKDIKPESLNACLSIWGNIKVFYDNILLLCKKSDEGSDSTSDSEYREPSEHKSLKMEFDLKTACNLIPVMDGNEKTVKSLIDAVEMYSDMLSDPGKMLLIKFVLKSRLTENAKLCLSPEYSTVEALIKDIKQTLLTKKSFTAIQSRLQTITQGYRSVAQYGVEVEKLLSDLTISQADGDNTKYSVLKPLNEKLAVKRFSDGLRDQRLSTIIAARNYEHLKEAIQAAKDEELHGASTSREDSIMQFSLNGRGKFHNNYSRGQPASRARSHHFNRRQYANNSTRGTFYGSGNRSRPNNYSYRGINRQRPNNRSSYSNTRGRGNFRQRVFYAQPSSQDTNPEVSNAEENQFFRS